MSENFCLCFDCVCRKQTSVSMLWKHLGKVVSTQFLLLAEEDHYRWEIYSSDLKIYEFKKNFPDCSLSNVFHLSDEITK